VAKKNARPCLTLLKTVVSVTLLVNYLCTASEAQKIPTPIPEEYQKWLQAHNAQEMEPVLIPPNDLISKINSFWALDIYAEHLRVWNNFIEKEPYKNSLVTFIDSFDNLLDNVANMGFDTHISRLPVLKKDYGWKALNGAHRIAACLLYHPQEKLVCHSIRKYFNSIDDVSWHYFKTLGLNKRYLDAMALQYCQLKKSTYCLILFPRAQGFDKRVRDLLEQNGAIVYEKKVYLSSTGTVNFMRVLYEGESWLGDWNNTFQGARGKAHSCFPADNGTVTIFLYETENQKRVIEVKKKIRALFNTGNHSIHSTDTHDETLRIAQAVFIENSIHFINNAKMHFCKRFEQLCSSYKTWLKANNYNSENFCIDSSAVLAAYGLRDCRDLDFLAHDYETSNTIPNIENHENQLKYYATTKDDIIFNPTYHFYHNGIKFASLDTIKKMKLNRHEYPKDIRDIELINSISS